MRAHADTTISLCVYALNIESETKMTRKDDRVRQPFLALAGASLLVLAGASSSALAQSADPRPPSASENQINIQPAPNLLNPTTAPGFNGPLGSIFAPLADRGYKFHVVAFDLFQGNPSAGLITGRGSNSTYILVGTDIDLGKVAGLQGTTLHYENTFFANVHNLDLAGQIGDSQIGYQPPYNPTFTRLSRATIEQKFLDGRLDIDVGITHPDRYYASPNCTVLGSCFQDILY